MTKKQKFSLRDKVMGYGAIALVLAFALVVGNTSPVQAETPVADVSINLSEGGFLQLIDRLQGVSSEVVDTFEGFFGASGSRFPSGLSADGTSPVAGQVRGTTLDITGNINIGSGTDLARVLHGTCNLTSYAAITATSTGWHDCAVTGVTTSDRVVLQLSASGSTFGSLSVSASRASTTAGYIGAEVLNLTGVATSSYAQASTSVEYWVYK